MEAQTATAPTGQPAYKGSSRDVYDVGGHTLEFRFKDTFSVFDVGMHHQTIPGKGKALCACAVKSFEIAKALGVRTHFVRQVNDSTIQVMKFAVLEQPLIHSSSYFHVLPLEFITRFAVAGSLERAFKKGKKTPADYGLSAENPPTGTPLPWPIAEYTTKREAIDRPLTAEEARDLAHMSADEEDHVWRIVHRLDGGLNIVAAQAGFARFDGKKEIGVGERVGICREIFIVDTFGTLDEDRYVPAALLREGRVVHYSKEMIRQLFIDNGYHAAVEKARAEGKEDPPYPDLTPGQIADIAERYERFAERYTAVKLDLLEPLAEEK